VFLSPGTACIALKRNIVIDFNDSVKGTLNEIIQKQRNVSRYVCVLIFIRTWTDVMFVQTQTVIGHKK